MITQEIDAADLEEFYTKLCKVQEDYHGDDYIDVHNEIRELLKQCDSYTEFGVMQGTTLAIPLLEKTPRVRGYDIQLTTQVWNAVRYDKGQHLFEQYANEHDIDFDVIEADTADCVIDSVDLLYIDSCHMAKHLQKELSLHANKVNKFIVFHDTAAKPELARVVRNFVDRSDEWVGKTVSSYGVGFMTIERKQ